ncbi:DUF4349 domain-containing protein [Paenibacillus sp.]|uniref:DUF4349 domain-containing protein n=1 Tax=Paenibacillus sp. TaxID=58172 RepID=UPI002D5F7FDF|nr:DUF4349 domain-containing protein [Paenibacillus sp.]HZG57856.1 DUF4349 domain-containing protein [Paenibacillus sp.]
MRTLRKGRLAAGLLAIALAALTAGCSGESGSYGNSAGGAAAEMAAPMPPMADMAMEAPLEMPASEEADGGRVEAVSSGSTAYGAGSGTSGSAPAVTAGAAAETGRMLIYKANVTMEVESYADAYTEIQNLIHLSGGYLVQFSEQTSDAERSGLFTIKVPAGDFDGFMDRLEKLPNVGLNRSMNAQDVSEEYVDLNARLGAKQVVEARYLEYMEGASRSEDLIRYTNELAAIQEEIERLKGRIRYLQANVAYSTVELRVYERDASRIAAFGQETPLGERMGAALRNSLNALASTAEAVMILLAGAIPILLAAILLGVPIYWFIRRRKAKTEKNRPLIP